MVTQFTPVQPGWQVQFRFPDDGSQADYPVLGWVFVPGVDGWELDAVVWHDGEPWDAQALADRFEASYNVVPA